MPKSRFVFSNKYDSISPELMTTSIWVSTSLALILTLPALGLFIVSLQVTSSIPISAMIGFGFHFGLLAISDRISSYLISFLNCQENTA